MNPPLIVTDEKILDNPEESSKTETSEPASGDRNKPDSLQPPSLQPQSLQPPSLQITTPEEPDSPNASRVPSIPAPHNVKTEKGGDCIPKINISSCNPANSPFQRNFRPASHSTTSNLTPRSNDSHESKSSKTSGIRGSMRTMFKAFKISKNESRSRRNTANPPHKTSSKNSPRSESGSPREVDDSETENARVIHKNKKIDYLKARMMIG